MGDGPPSRDAAIELDEGLFGLIKPELEPGERLIWAARSRGDQGRGHAGHLRAIGWVAGLFLFSVSCFAILPFRFVPSEVFIGTMTILGTTALATSMVVGLIVVLRYAGHLLRSWRRVPDVYAITDRRAIIWTASPVAGAVDVVVLPYGSIHAQSIHRTQFPDGTGDLHLSGYRPNSSFRGIDEVRRVENLVRAYLVASPHEAAP